MIYKSAIVAGGAGFVGSHLCRRLLRDGYAVTCIDDLSTGCMNNISSLMENTQFRFMEQDITSLTDMPGAVDEIYNLACPASPVQYQKNPIQTFRTNVIGSMNCWNWHHRLLFQNKATNQDTCPLQKKYLKTLLTLHYETKSK